MTGISCRMFLLDQNDGLHRLPSTKLNQIPRDPTSCRLTCFSGASVRMTVVAVELLERQPIRIIWNTFYFLAFDDEGYFDSGTFDHHQRAGAEPKGTVIVVDATARFVAKGGCWRPARTS